MSRPELTGHASLFYNAKEARKYNSSSRMVGVQREITERAIELLRLPEDRPSFVLDVGCGSGLSGQVLEEKGHAWVGCDVSRDMLNVANERIKENMLERSEAAASGGIDMDDDDDEDDDALVALCQELAYLDVTGPTMKSRLVVDASSPDQVEECLLMGINKFVLSSSSRSSSSSIQTDHHDDDMAAILMQAQLDWLQTVVQDQGKKLMISPS
mmetsp:Transcript_3439/g.6277  ORF Transcript_3439/g.6277 Transcript_3439/m.6277 type:complete len:213 (-) Transcript_3439:2005-2643(-)